MQKILLPEGDLAREIDKAIIAFPDLMPPEGRWPALYVSYATYIALIQDHDIPDDQDWDDGLLTIGDYPVIPHGSLQQNEICYALNEELGDDPIYTAGMDEY